jgi:hypothetical protein
VQESAEQMPCRPEGTSGTGKELVLSQPKLLAVDHPGVSPLVISGRLRAQLPYFMTPPSTPGVPPLGENELWIAQADVSTWLADGIVCLVSPLDSAHQLEVELSEEQESLLNWLKTHGIQHVRVID